MEFFRSGGSCLNQFSDDVVNTSTGIFIKSTGISVGSGTGAGIRSGPGTDAGIGGDTGAEDGRKL